MDRTPLADRLPLIGGVLAALIVVAHTAAPVMGATDERIFRDALVRMHRGVGYYPAMRAALAGQDATASQVRSIRLPTEFLLLRPFPVSSYRWLGAAVALASVLLCWRLAKDAHPAAQAMVLVGAGLWMGSLLEAVYLYAEIWALPFFLIALLAVRDDRWTVAAVALLAAVCVRELYLPALLIAGCLAPRGKRWPFGLAVVAAAVVGGVHYALASQQLVAHGDEAPFNGFADLPATLVSMVTPKHALTIAVPTVAITVVGAIGVVRSWRTDVAARLAGATALCLVAATVFGGRIYWPLMFAPALVAFAGAAFPAEAGGAAPEPAGQADVDDARHASGGGSGNLEAWSNAPQPVPSPTAPAPTSSRTPTAG